MAKNRVKLLQKDRPDLHRTAKGFFMRVHRPSRGWWLVQADKEPRLHLEKGAAAAALHRADGYIRAGASRGRTPAMISHMGGSETDAVPKQSGTLWATTTGTLKDTPALDALKASCGAPISMGRGEIPVRLAATSRLFCS